MRLRRCLVGKQFAKDCISQNRRVHSPFRRNEALHLGSNGSIGSQVLIICCSWDQERDECILAFESCPPRVKRVMDDRPDLNPIRESSRRSWSLQGDDVEVGGQELLYHNFSNISGCLGLLSALLILLLMQHLLRRWQCSYSRTC